MRDAINRKRAIDSNRKFESVDLQLKHLGYA